MKNCLHFEVVDEKGVELSDLTLGNKYLRQPNLSETRDTVR